MNKQDAMRRIEAIEAEAAELRRMVQEEDKPMRLPRFGPDGRGFHLDAFGTAHMTCSSHLPVNHALETHGNCFTSKEQAEKASPLFARAHKIIQAALLADPDAGIFSKERQFTAVQGGDGGWKALTDNSLWQCHGAHVHTREQAEHMAAILNAEGVK